VTLTTAGTALQPQAGAAPESARDLRELGSLAAWRSYALELAERYRQVTAELSDAQSYEQAVITACPDAIHIYDVATATMSRANRLAPELIGYTQQTIAVMSGTCLDNLLPAEDLVRYQQALSDSESAADGEVIKLRHRIVHDDGDVRWLSRRLTPFQRDEHGHVTQTLIVSRDITDSVALEEQLAHAALHDDLTGLPNRRMVVDRLSAALRRSEPPGEVAVLFCDLDGFKRINDSHGHSTGDRVLMATADRLRRATRNGDTVARMGGDEFVVIVDIPATEDCRTLAERVAARIEQAVAEPILVDGEEHAVTVSIGIALAGPDSTPQEMLSDADTAMYHAKGSGANRHTVFESTLRQEPLGRDHAERRIRRALERDLIQVFYQPIVDPVTEHMTGVEALLRVPDVDGRWLDTGRVISVADQRGLIAAIDDRVVRIACAQVARWRALPKYRDLTLHLNRSAKDIAQPGFCDRLVGVLSESGLEPSALTVEVTETVLLDPAPGTLTDLLRLRELGIGIAIDDFGTGYASLRYLATLPITCIKIDHSFTSGIPADRTCMTVVRATIGLAEDLEIGCVVEGVETLEQLRALPDYPGLQVQGYLLGRPRAASAF